MDLNIHAEPSLSARLALSSLAVSRCFQCLKCSGGCSLTFAMDLMPAQVIRLAFLGQEKQVLGCRTIWVCSGCTTCTTRCPNGIDIAGVMDWLKEEAFKQGETSTQPLEAVFHRCFLESIRQAGGRLPEGRMLWSYGLFKLRRKPDLGELAENLKVALKLFKKGRLRLAGPEPLKGRAEIDEIFKKANF